MSLFDEIMAARGLTAETASLFLSPRYESGHDPYLLPDMEKAVVRLVAARASDEHITIYGDYDIDGLTATTVLVDGFEQFGFSHVEVFIPNRFVEGYGMTIDAVERIAATGATLIVTVDCGSLSEKEIIRASELGVDVIVTDHHNVPTIMPPAVAVINPKRVLEDHPDDFENYLLKSSSSLKGTVYPFLDLPGVGVAFKLIQALQTRLDGMPKGQEKWLLDLVALGTVCDVVTLRDENRMHVFFGLKVLARTKRPGLKALMAVAGVIPKDISARHLGFGLGPRMNAAGRLETAQYALDMLLARDGMVALETARHLDEMNQARKTEQAIILKQAIIQADTYSSDPVLVVSAPGWNHGIVGIVAAKLLEKYKKPAYVLAEEGEQSKGSARSFGDFSAADAIRAADDIITKGGGHKLAAGVTLPTKNIDAFRARVNEFYRTQKLFNQAALLLPRADVTIATFEYIDEQLLAQISSLEPFGSANPEPLFRADLVRVINKRVMGAEGQHVKITVEDSMGSALQLIAFSAPQAFFVEPGETISVWFQPGLNEWQGRRTIEGRLLHVEADTI